MSAPIPRLARTAAFLDGWVRRHIAAHLAGADAELARAVASKAEHTRQVRANCVALARHLRLSERDVRCADLMGLLHDLGRFGQFAAYRTFNDGHSLDHAALALALIDRHHLLTRLLPDDRRRIRFAVAWHNKKGIGGTDDPVALTCAKVLRDADKLDIYRVLEPHIAPPQGGFSAEFLARFEAGEQVDYNCVRSADDLKLVRLMWVYDVNYDWTLRRIAERGHIDRIAAALPDIPGVAAGLARLRRHVRVRLEGDREHGNGNDHG